MAPLQLLASGMTSGDTSCYFCQETSMTLSRVNDDVTCDSCGAESRGVLESVAHIDDNDISDVVGAIDGYKGEYMADTPDCVSHMYNDNFCSRLFAYLAALYQSYNYNISY